MPNQNEEADESIEKVSYEEHETSIDTKESDWTIPCPDCETRSKLDKCKNGCELATIGIGPIFKSIDIDCLHPDPEQPRKTFDEENLNGLAQTLKDNGMLQPIVADGTGKIILGERRWRAAKMAGLEKVPVVIKHCSDPFIAQLIVDTHNEKIPILEKAEAWNRLKEERALSNEEIGQLLGISKVHVGRVLRLVGMPKGMQNALKADKITATDLMEIRSLPEEDQMETLTLCIDRQRTREEMRTLIKARKNKLISNVRRPSRKPEEVPFSDNESRPKDVFRRLGSDNLHQNVVVASNHETMKHFVVKAMVYKLLRAMGRVTLCEMEAGSGVVDIFDTETRYAYEVESNPGPNTGREKLKQFANRVADVLIIDLNKVPNELEAMAGYLQTRII